MWTAAVASQAQRKNLFMVDKLREYFGKIFGPIQVAYLFGSHASGQQGPLSDLDIGIVFTADMSQEDKATHQMNTVGDLMQLLHYDRVDVVSLRDATLLLQHRAISNGILLYEKSPIFRVQYETEVLRKYLDFLPFHDFYFKKMRERISDGTFGNG